MSARQQSALTGAALLSAQTQATLRQISALVLLHQSTAQQQQSNDEQPFVLSHTNGNVAHTALMRNVKMLMSFVEELFAVRLPRFAIFAVILTFGVILARVVPLVFNEILRRFRVARHYRACARYLLQIGIFVLALWLSLAAIGIDFVGIVLTFGVVSIVISAGVSGTVSNVFGGIMLQTDDTVQYGHDITINGIRGIVVGMSLSSVTLRRFEDKSNYVIVPNSFFSQYPVQIHRDTSNTTTSKGTNALGALMFGKTQ